MARWAGEIRTLLFGMAAAGVGFSMRELSAPRTLCSAEMDENERRLGGAGDTSADV
jgi:hypothetical protein